MKKCPKCQQLLAAEMFSRNRVRLSSYCRACQSEYCKAHYRRNARLHNFRRGVNMARYKERNRQLIREYLARHPCVDCGNAAPRVLEFDHVRGKKEMHISSLVQRGCAWGRIVGEIAKCEVRCANCHRRRTVETLRWPHAIDRGVAQLGRASALGAEGPQVQILSPRPTSRPWSNGIRHESSKLEDGGSSPSGRMI
jgi:hypothetical protein